MTTLTYWRLTERGRAYLAQLAAAPAEPDYSRCVYCDARIGLDAPCIACDFDGLDDHHSEADEAAAELAWDAEVNK